MATKTIENPVKLGKRPVEQHRVNRYSLLVDLRHPVKLGKNLFKIAFYAVESPVKLGKRPVERNPINRCSLQVDFRNDDSGQRKKENGVPR